MFRRWRIRLYFESFFFFLEPVLFESDNVKNYKLQPIREKKEGGTKPALIYYTDTLSPILLKTTKDFSYVDNSHLFVM